MLKLYWKEGQIEAGCDEAGRGCLAGPVHAAAVILPPDFKNETLNDSKQLSEKQRNELRIIIEKEAVAWAVATCTPKRIDKINILNASFEAMTKAVENLGTTPELLLIDGNRFRTKSKIPYECVIKGDAKFLSIAAASILAKTHRDEYMKKIAETHPEYAWESNKGYPTKAHREAIRIHGSTTYHRQSFRLLPLAIQGELFQKK
ncbi:MAG: ribonuclease HII [Saprospiraceae bacterium]